MSQRDFSRQLTALSADGWRRRFSSLVVSCGGWCVSSVMHWFCNRLLEVAQKLRKLEIVDHFLQNTIFKISFSFRMNTF